MNASPPFPENDAVLMLHGPCGALEAVVEFPATDTPRRAVVAVVCHPLPTEGGTLHNKVVTMTARAMRELGVVTVRFNFRGTGASHGQFDAGRGEQEDLAAVVAWVRAQQPDAQLWLAGFSFGAFVSISAATRLGAAALVSLAPPAGRWQFPPQAPQMPWLVIQGEADEIVDPKAVYDWLAGLDAAQMQLVKIPQCSHFFHGKLLDLRHGVQQHVRGWLPEAVA